MHNKIFVKHKHYYILLLTAAIFTTSGYAQTAIKRKGTFPIKETFNRDDLPANDYLQAQLKPIRSNFKRINTIKHWTTIKEQNIETGEGLSVTFYYLDKQLEKIVTRQYGETFQQLNEYYLYKGQLSFVLERSYSYNRPIYYDSTVMKEQADTVAFDFNKSEIEEARNYFENDKLIHQLSNQDCGAPFATDYLLEEQKRIKANFDSLTKLEAGRHRNK